MALPRRVAWMPHLNGLAPVDPEVWEIHITWLIQLYYVVLFCFGGAFMQVGVMCICEALSGMRGLARVDLELGDGTISADCLYFFDVTYVGAIFISAWGVG